MGDDEVLDSVRRDLTDGQDLALAAQLIADALVRRVRRARRTLDTVELRLRDGDPEAAGDAKVRRHVDLLRERTSGFEREMRRLSDRLERTMAAYEDELQQLADEVDDEMG